MDNFEYAENDKRIKVLTPSGYKSFKGIRKLEKECIRLETENGFIECSCDHPLYNSNRVIKADEVFVGTTVQMNGESEKITKIEFIGKQVVYDLIGVAGGHLYFTNNMLSHNCSFSGSSYTLIEGKHLSKLASVSPIETTRDKTKIYIKPEPNRIYVLGVDTAKYGEGDYLSMHVVDITTKPFVQVATFREKDLTYLDLIDPMYELASLYNNAYIFIENNSGDGQSTIDLMVERYEYDNVYSEKNEIWGFRTTTKSRKIGLQNLKQLVQDDGLIINDDETIQELMRFARKNGKYQATDGYSDDAVLALVACLYFLQLRNFVDIEDLSKFFNATKEEDDPFIFGFMTDINGNLEGF